MQSRLKHPQHVIIVTHTFFYGASEALRDYFISQKIHTLLYIGHPLLPEKSSFTLTRVQDGQNVDEYITQRKSVASIPALIRDAFVTLRACFALPNQKYVYIGVNPLNACVGILLRICKRVDRVIFYAIDFVPVRSKWKVINFFYHKLEAFAVLHADMCWNISPRVEAGRQKFLGIVNTRNSQIVVPIGVWKSEIADQVKLSNNYRLIFVGHLLKKQGIQEVLHAFPTILAKVPRATLTIIGGGEYKEYLQELTKELSLDSHVNFLGWESDQDVIRKHIRKSDLALATYEPSGEDTTNFSYYADPTKIKTYLSCGTPILMTEVSYNAKNLVKAGVAVVVPYDRHVIASLIIRLFTHTAILNQMKKRAIKEAYQFRWDVIFSKALQSV